MAANIIIECEHFMKFTPEVVFALITSAWCTKVVMPNIPDSNEWGCIFGDFLDEMLIRCHIDTVGLALVAGCDYRWDDEVTEILDVAYGCRRTSASTVSFPPNMVVCGIHVDLLCRIHQEGEDYVNGCLRTAKALGNLLPTIGDEKFARDNETARVARRAPKKIAPVISNEEIAKKAAEAEKCRAELLASEETDRTEALARRAQENAERKKRRETESKKAIYAASLTKLERDVLHGRTHIMREEIEKREALIDYADMISVTLTKSQSGSFSESSPPKFRWDGLVKAIDDQSGMDSSFCGTSPAAAMENEAGIISPLRANLFQNVSRENLAIRWRWNPYSPHSPSVIISDR
jgi:hypothetical protein